MNKEYWFLLNPYTKAIIVYKNAPHFKHFWEQGNGKDLLEWSQASVSLDQFEQHKKYFYKVDELGDQVIKDFYYTQSFYDANKKIDQFIEEGIKAASVPQSVVDFFSSVEEIPDWLDNDLLKMGAETCMKTGHNALILLRDYTLMGGYDFASLNKPLIYTGVLHNGAFKRLSETLRFWVNVSRHNALEIHQKGYKSAIKVRLAHSLARLEIKKNFKDLDLESIGEPINQWDMMATGIGMSLIFLHGLHKLGIHCSEEEELGVFHLWKYLGYLLGIPLEIIPENKKEATEFFYLWTANQPPADDDSVLLANALIKEARENEIFEHQFQRNLLSYAHISLARYCLSEKVVERLQIPRVFAPKFVPFTMKCGTYFSQLFRTREQLIERGNKIQLDVLQSYQEFAGRVKR